MRQKSGTPKLAAERVVKDIRRKTRKQHSAEEKIRIVLEGLRGEGSIAEVFGPRVEVDVGDDDGRAGLMSAVDDLVEQMSGLRAVLALDSVEAELVNE